MRLLVSWSSGKDSAWTLHCLQQSGEHEIVGLLTTVNANFDRVAMHGTRSEFLHAQAAAARLPLWTIPLPWPCSNQQYETAMGEAIARALRERVEGIAFGDLFLADIRHYREQQLEGTCIQPLFPLWGRNTRTLAQEMISGGLKARLVCIDPNHLDSSFAGREFDQDLLESLPPDVDSCGENGEFHTAVYAGPMLRETLPAVTGESVERSGFLYSDLRLR